MLKTFNPRFGWRNLRLRRGRLHADCFKKRWLVFVARKKGGSAGCSCLASKARYSKATVRKSPRIFRKPEEVLGFRV